MAKEASSAERLEWLKDTLYQGSSAQLELPDEHLAELMFSDFDTGTWSFLHDKNLSFLLSRGLISEALSSRCRSIREHAIAAIETADRPVTGRMIRESSAWREIRRLCDEALLLCP